MLLVAVRQALIALAVLLGAFAWVAWNRRGDSALVREAAYARFADLGEPAEVRGLVDRHHEAVFWACYRPGAGGEEPELDARAYVMLMDERIRFARDAGEKPR